MSTDHLPNATDPASLPDALPPVVPDAAEPSAEPEASAAPEAAAAEMPAADAAATAATAATAAAPAPRMDLAACAAELKARFPALFGGAPKPIKLRIQVDIQARAPGVFTRQALSTFLHRHTTSTNYLIALSQQPQRVDLDGQPAGEVAAEHRDAAAKEVERRRTLRKEREAQIHEARRAAIQAERDKAREHFRQQREAQREQQQQQAPQRPQRPPPPPRPAQVEAPREEDPGRRERARLLRDFESSPLTKANFCALKGLTVELLDAQLAQAREEAAAWAAAHPPAPRSDRPQGDRPHGDRARTDRPDRPRGDRPRGDRPRSEGHPGPRRPDDRRPDRPDRPRGPATPTPPKKDPKA